jgi:hypothetical protein
MENEATTKTPIPTRSGFRNFALCTCLHPDPLGLIFAFSTYLSCHEFIASDPPFLSMDYFSVFSAFSVAISFVPSCLSGHESIMQNKANFKMGNINISTAIAKPYTNKQRTMNNKHYSKQTQSNPISTAQTPYPACRTKHCRGDKAQVHNPHPHLFPWVTCAGRVCSVEPVESGRIV